MNHKRILAALTGLSLVVSPSFAQEDRGGAGSLVTVTPEPSEEILRNPGMGWQTFHHSGRHDPSLPDWIPSTVSYFRWGWAELEPRPGEIDHGLLDRVIKEIRASGQSLAFRVMCCSTTRNEPYHPRWLAQAGGKELIADLEGIDFPIPDLDDPVTLRRHLDFLKRLGERYDGHPGIDHVDIGSIGWWGEWHLSGSRKAELPRLENRIKVLDAYLAAFKKTPLLMLVGGGECLKYAAEHGAGWRADCLGDLGGFSKTWCHMRKGYPSDIKESGVEGAWKAAPVAWETCWDMRKWVEEGWSLRYIFNYALALHGSYINNKSAPLPDAPGVRPELERFLRRLGYRLVLKRLRHPSVARPGTILDLDMQWQNVGSARCYRPYRLAYRLSGDGGHRKVFVGGVTVDRWLPGSMELFTEEFLREPGDLPPGEITPVRETITLPADLPEGEFDLAVAVVGESTADPVVRLGIKGRSEDGWYPLSRIRVTR
ncbi:MAG: DUF4832 domain-containing protein [Isosphaeraceae bacterium]